MVQRVSTVAFEGIEARAVDVQVQVAPGLPAFAMVRTINPSRAFIFSVAVERPQRIKKAPPARPAELSVGEELDQLGGEEGLTFGNLRAFRRSVGLVLHWVSPIQLGGQSPATAASNNSSELRGSSVCGPREFRIAPGL